MRKSIFLALFLVCAVFVFAQNTPKDVYVVGFYNLENLFDTIHDEGKNDYQFLPDGDNGWGTLKYQNKLKNMAYAISKMPKSLAILGVSEIENIGALTDLANEPQLADRHFVPILVEGPDKRGVDVGVLYNSELFTPLNVVSHPYMSDDPNFITRDQLCVTGILGGDTLSFIVMHWPSRAAKPKARYDAGATAKFICDSLFAINPNANIVLVGDYNDDPTDKSVCEYLGAKGKIEKVARQGDLFNTTYKMFKKGGIGSLGYQDKWSLFDQIVISSNLLWGNGSHLTFLKTEIYNKEFLTQQDGKFKGYPLRTHSGGVWTNGYSDHFPALMWLVKNR